MITTRRVAGLAVAAVVALAVGLWMARDDDASGYAEAGARVLPGLAESLSEVNAVTIRKTGGLVTTLTRTDAGWLVAERQYPVDTGRLRKLLLDLGSMTVLEEKTSDPHSFAKLGVEDAESAGARSSRIDVTTPTKTYSLLIGRAGGTKDVFVRGAEAKQALLASPQILVEADPRRWIDHSIVDVPLARVARLEVTPVTGSAYSARRDDPKAGFVLDSESRPPAPVIESDLQAVAESLAALTADDVRELPANPSSPAATTQSLRLVTFDGLSISVRGYKEASRFWVRFSAESDTPADAAKAKEASTLNSRGASHEFEIPAYKYDALFRSLTRSGE